MSGPDPPIAPSRPTSEADLRPTPVRQSESFNVNGSRIALFLATLALLCDLSPLDRWVATRFFDPALHAFPARHAFWAEDVLHRGGIWLVALVALSALGLLIGSIRSGRLRRWRREAAFLLACIVLTTGSIGLLKRTTDVDCPWDLAEYGGSNPYVHVFQPKPLGLLPGRCFPGGHSSGGFSLMAIGFVLAARRSRWARPVLIAAFALGLGFAVTQWARGAHFPSHDLWSAFIAWNAAWWLARAMLATPVAAFCQPARIRAAVAARMAVALLLLVGGSSPRTAIAADPIEAVPIREIVFRSNETTRPEVMLREMSIAIGQPADPIAIERSRQAVQNLGLFRKVTVEQEPLEEGVRVVFSLKEKWYLLAYPRLSANTEGENSLGAEMRWNNVFGRNHSLRALVTSDDHREEGRGRQLSYIGNYHAPFAFGSNYTIDLSSSHSTTPVAPAQVLEGAAGYDERADEVQLLVSRKFGFTGSASQGWNAGSGVVYRRQDISSDSGDAPAAFGNAWAAVAQLGYQHVQDYIYSESGTRFSTRFEIADQNLGSDYSYSRLSAGFKRSIALGSLPHQTLEWTANLGSYNNGPAGKDKDYSLGGANGLRGYQRDSFQGDFYYLLGVNYLRPLYWDWLRVVAGAEAGNVYDDADKMNTQLRWSFNLGLRARVTRLVNFEFEMGIALPLDHDSGRFYGSRYGF
ncbi:MAG: phosphatase PAP2 family protein [Panacagrimonas sp.]